MERKKRKQKNSEDNETRRNLVESDGNLLGMKENEREENKKVSERRREIMELQLTGT